MPHPGKQLTLINAVLSERKSKNIEGGSHVFSPFVKRNTEEDLLWVPDDIRYAQQMFGSHHFRSSLRSDEGEIWPLAYTGSSLGILSN
ncbi:hypothetical protein SUGI_0622380 [Cryptomeria japonica]|nr:hypothetical protein SUGI_0622380 [Cryptomeria japonica]